MRACESAHCVEVYKLNGKVVITDTKTNDHLVFTIEEWEAFRLGVKGGEFDDLQEES